jgi:phosphate transport system permease protein
VESYRRGINGDAVFRGVAGFFALLVLVLAATVVVTAFVSARQTLTRYGFSFFTSDAWDPNVKFLFGARPFIYGTLVTSVVALLISGVIGIGVALLLVELRLPRWFSTPISFLVELLAAIPSIVFGVWGFVVIIPAMQAHVDPFLHNTFGWLPCFGADTGGGATVLTASLILAVMIVPTVAAISRDVIRVVPDNQREAMIALGATRWEMIFQAVLPYARSGIIGALILALGRAVGETIAATMVIGNASYIGPNLLSSGDTLASKIANNFSDASDLARSALFELGLILLLLSVALNVLARLLVWSVSRGSGQVA